MVNSMKRVIALYGTPNSGKTCTLKQVHYELSKSEKVISKHSKTGADFRDIFIINGIKVGIETQGDPVKRHKESLKLFQEQKCDLIICATRSRGKTKESVKALQKEYFLSWRGQSRVSDKELIKDSNLSIASLILKEAKSFIYA